MDVRSQFFLGALLVFAASHLCNAENEKLQVATGKGVVQGHYLNSRGGKEFVAFQGIPYAKPPLGKLRFKPPQPAEPWEGVLNATQDSSICVQRNIYMGGTDVEGQEDCLYLNVYTPELPGGGGEARPRPVMVWIHGGGWLSGGGILGFYSPAHLMDRDVVLVTFNYRLGFLGFISTGDKVCPGNNGMKDQVTALRWVRDNIAAFGGDPNSVTIFGQSAGGASVHYHVISPMSRGLFHRAISMSGSAFCPWSFAPGGTSKHQTEKLAALLSCPTDSSESLMACLEKKDAYDIIGTDLAFTEWDWHPHVPFRPVIESEVPDGEEAFLAKDPRVAVAQKDIAPVPWMTGLTSADGALLAVGIFQDEKLLKELNDDFDRIAPIILFYRNTSNSVDEITKKVREFYLGEQPIDSNAVYEVVDMFTDGFFTAGLDEAVKAHATANVAPVYYYVFDYRGTHTYASFVGDATLNDYGVCHGDDLLYLFPFGHFFPGIIPTEDDEKVVDILTTLWSNFARSGNPTPEATDLIPEQWQPATTGEQNYFHISSEVFASTDLLRERAEFWASLPIRDKYLTAVKDEL